jgi:hypothetical protein
MLDKNVRHRLPILVQLFEALISHPVSNSGSGGSACSLEEKMGDGVWERRGRNEVKFQRWKVAAVQQEGAKAAPSQSHSVHES